MSTDTNFIAKEQETGIENDQVTSLPSSDSIKDIVEDFYRKYNPEKISTIDSILEKYRDNEAQLLVHLKEKYSIDNYEPFDRFIRQNQDRLASNASSPVKFGSGNSSLPPPNINLQEISSDIAQRLFSGWNNATAPTSTSQMPLRTDYSNMSSDEILLMNRIQNLQNENQAMVAEKAYLEATVKKIKSQVIIV